MVVSNIFQKMRSFFFKKCFEDFLQLQMLKKTQKSTPCIVEGTNFYGLFQLQLLNFAVLILMYFTKEII